MCQSSVYTVLIWKVIVTAPVNVLICVGWFSTYWCCGSVVGSSGDKGVQERYGTIFFGVSCGELDVWVQGVDVLEELRTMFCLLDDKGFTQIPEP